MSKRTPGPWEVDSFRIAGPDGATVAWLPHSEGSFPNKPENAHLIAAAPELLQELLNIAHAPTETWDDPSEFEAWAKSRARAAIAKASAAPLPTSEEVQPQYLYGLRNPLLALPAAQGIAKLPPEAKAVLRTLLLDLSRDARQRAEYSWRSSKAPMAVYWKAIAVYARHIAALLKETP